jgi:hypothetical protein
MPRIRDAPLEKWPPGWLKLEVARLSQESSYLIMTDKEKKSLGLPVTEEEMRAFIKRHS